MKQVYTFIVFTLLTFGSYGANITVLNNNDAGTGSLRNAVANVGVGDTVFFDVGINNSTIILLTPITIANDIVIFGPPILLGWVTTGIWPIVISGGNLTRVFSISSGATVSINWINITEGNVSTGAGILNSGTLELNYCRFYNNNCTVTSNNDQGGAALYNNTNGVATVNNCEFYDNTSNAPISNMSNGGAIFNRGVALDVNYSSFYGNIVSSPLSSRGGAIYNATTLNINSSTFFRNECQSPGVNKYGGTIANNSVTSILNIRNSTITRGEALGGQGGNIWNQGTLQLENTIVEKGNSQIGNDVFTTIGQGVTVSLGNNILMDSLFAAMTFIIGDTLIDPWIDTLKYNNDAFTKTCSLLCGSPAVNAGNNVNAPALDQAGQARVFGGTIDIGAYEAQSNTGGSIPMIYTVNVGLTTGSYTTYQWYLNGAVISGASSQNYTPTVNGDYTVEVTDANGCSMISSIFNMNNVGLGELNSYGINVYPNPTENDLFISSKDVLSVTITNSLGATVKTFSIKAGENQLDVSELTNGFYILQFVGEDSFVGKTTFIKQ
ncbi:MAG: T9SS type A sorting domain-containing protein [Fluviicola sp.]|nr:T9SS type A sorting domain-containing protein [Fluviicola sp.]